MLKGGGFSGGRGLFLRPPLPKICPFYCIFKKQFSAKGFFWSPNFSEKSRKKCTFSAEITKIYKIFSYFSNFLNKALVWKTLRKILVKVEKNLIFMLKNTIFWCKKALFFSKFSPPSAAKWGLFLQFFRPLRGRMHPPLRVENPPPLEHVWCV